MSVVLIAGLAAACGGEGGANQGGGSSRTSTTTTRSSSPSTTSTPTSTTPKPTTPLEVFDQRAIGFYAWPLDGFATATEYLRNFCGQLDAPEPAGETHGELLEETLKTRQMLLEEGIPLVCPQHVGLLADVKAGKIDRVIYNGSYLVPDQIKPGKYQTVSTPVEDCYWERTSAGGDIIDNKFVTAAKQLTVTIKPSDGAFTTRGCGGWRKVG